MSTLLILDGNAVIHRAFHAVPPLSSAGQQLNAVYGFYSTLISAIDKVKPKYLAICLDPPGPVFRNDEFIGYRSQRKPAPPELKSQFPIVIQSLKNASLPIFSVGGYEADDAIATICRRSFKKLSKKTRSKLVTQVYILTGDRDLMQLIDDHTQLLMPGRGLSDLQISGHDQSLERLGVAPDKVVDLKAITGDSSDNYPGVPGVGPVGAIKLLQDYGSLDNIYNNIDKLPPKLKEKFTTHRQDAYLSQRLAQLVFDVPLSFQLKDLLYTQKTIDSLIPVLQSYNFRSLVSRLKGKGADSRGVIHHAQNGKSSVSKTSDPNQPSLF